MAIREIFGTARRSTDVPDLAQGMEIPPALQASVSRHQANLARLANNLHVCGLGVQQIEESINMLVETYRAELVGAVRALIGSHP